MLILCEELKPSECNIITESSTDGKTMWLNGICMQANVHNRNGRNYPLHEITAAVNAAKQTIAECNGIFGELSHPQNLSINEDRISHAITEMWMSGTNAYGKAKLLNTPMGLISQEIFKSGVKTGVSSRGAGNVNESGDVSGFQFLTYDIVAKPSASLATPAIVYENFQEGQGYRILTLAEQLQKDPAAQKYFTREIKKFLNSF